LFDEFGNEVAVLFLKEEILPPANIRQCFKLNPNFLIKL